MPIDAGIDNRSTVNVLKRHGNCMICNGRMSHGRKVDGNNRQIYPRINIVDTNGFFFFVNMYVSGISVKNHPTLTVIVFACSNVFPL